MNLALQLLKESGFNQSIINSFENNNLIKTNITNPFSNFEQELSNQEKEIVSHLSQKGFEVYHILNSNKIVGNLPDINSSFKINTFQDVVMETNYLYVPRIIQEDNGTNQAILRVDDQREEIFIEEFIDYLLARAHNGIHYSYSIRGIKSSAPVCRDISISNDNGSIIIN